MSLDLHSILCVPLINVDGKRLGVIQADRFCKGFGFRVTDLHLVTAIGMQVAVVLEGGGAVAGGLGLRHPELHRVELGGAPRILLGVGDPVTGGHQIELPGLERLFGAQAVVQSDRGAPLPYPP